RAQSRDRAAGSVVRHDVAPDRGDAVSRVRDWQPRGSVPLGVTLEATELHRSQPEELWMEVERTDVAERRGQEHDVRGIAVDVQDDAVVILVVAVGGHRRKEK